MLNVGEGKKITKISFRKLDLHMKDFWKYLSSAYDVLCCRVLKKIFLSMQYSKRNNGNIMDCSLRISINILHFFLIKHTSYFKNCFEMFGVYYQLSLQDEVLANTTLIKAVTRSRRIWTDTNTEWIVLMKCPCFLSWKRGIFPSGNCFENKNLSIHWSRASLHCYKNLLE